MELLWRITAVLFGGTYSYLQTATTILFLHCFYDQGFQWNRKKALLLLALTAIETVFTFFMVGPVLAEAFSPDQYEEAYVSMDIPLPEIIFGFVTMIGVFAIVLYDYQGKRGRGLAKYLWVFAAVVICTTIVSGIGSQYVLPGEMVYSLEEFYFFETFIYLLPTIFFGSIFLYLYRRVFSQGLFLRVQKRERVFATIYVAVCLILYPIFLEGNQNDQILLQILGITFILTAVLVPVFFFYLRVSGHYQERTETQQGYIQAELDHFQQYRLAQEDTARFRHDIRNNLLCVNDLLRQGKNQEAADYLQDLLGTVEELSRTYVTGDTLLDSIVAAKAQIMQRKGIRFELDGVVAGGLPWKPVDICSVFANALDNAIEACQKVDPEKRLICMIIKATPQFWLISIENPTAEAVDPAKLFRKTGGYTTKANAALHGIGTYNMKHTVESYGDMLKSECTEALFKLEIVIDKSSPR